MAAQSNGASASSQFISAIFASKTPEGLKLTEYEWENEYRGTETAFIESGFIKSEWLPGKPGNAKRTVRVGIKDGEMEIIPIRSLPTDDQWKNGLITITRSSKKRLIVSVNCLPEEFEKREEAEFAKRKQGYIQKAHAEIEKKISELPANPHAFLERTQHTVRCFVSVILNGLADGCGYSGGYRFSSDVITAFEAGTAHAAQLIQEAHIHFDPEIRQKEITDIQNEVWAKYPCLSRAAEVHHG